MPEPPLPAKPFSLSLGARDWEHPAWAGDYYPEDLPEDWRLGYYANELRQVLMPQSRWVAAGPAGWADWLDAVGAGFRFFLELGPGPAPAALVACIQALGDHCGGVVAEGQPHAVTTCPSFLRRTRVAPPPSGSPPLALVLTPQQLGDPRAQRRLFEALAREFGAQGELPLFLGGEGPVMATLLEAKQLAELLGIA